MAIRKWFAKVISAITARIDLKEIVTMKWHLFTQKTLRDTDSSDFFLKYKLIAVSLFLLVLSLGFNAMLTLSSLEKVYIDSIVSKYSLTGNTLKRKLEGALGFGKSIEKFIGMDELLQETKQSIFQTGFENSGNKDFSPSDISVSVAAIKGAILYSTDQDLVNKSMEPYLNQKTYFRYGKFYLIPFSVYNSLSKEKAAFIFIGFHEKHVKMVLESVLKKNIKTILIILFIGFALLVLVFHTPVFSGIDQAMDKKLPKLKISIILFLIIGLSQVAFTGLNTMAFRNYYLDISRQKISVLGALLKKDIDFLLSKGIRIDRLVKIEDMLQEIIAAAPELDSIVILDPQGKPLYKADKKKNPDPQMNLSETDIQTDSEYSYHIKILKDEKIQGVFGAPAYQGSISTYISKAALYLKIKEIALDSVTVLVISFLFFLEMQIMIFNFFNTRSDEKNRKKSFMSVRITAFPLLISGTMSVSFLPLFMDTLFEPLFGLSKNIVMGLPISIKLFFTGLSIIVSGVWCDRRGWHEPFLAGALLTCIGNLYSWQARDALQFIIAQGIGGLGYGLALMASQGFIVTNTDEHRRAQGLSNLFAGVYSGSICGIALGAMLAERAGYRPVFFIGSFFILPILIYYLAFMRDAKKKPDEKITGTQSRPAIQYIFNRNILGLIIFSGIPAAVATIGFLNYFSPVYLKQLGASQSDIGRLFLINGLCMVYIAPYVSKLIDRSESKKKYVVLSGLIGSIAFVCFQYASHTAGVFLTVLLLGISASINDPSRNSYLLKLGITREFGISKSLSISSSSYRIGQVLGPLIFGILLSVYGMDGIMYLGALYLVITLVFLIMNENDAKIVQAVLPENFTQGRNETNHGDG